MQKLKQLSGKEIVKIFESYGFVLKRIKGSHVRLTLVTKESSHHITIPLHDKLKIGTYDNIVKEFENCFGKEESTKCFYN